MKEKIKRNSLSRNKDLGREGGINLYDGYLVDLEINQILYKLEKFMLLRSKLYKFLLQLDIELFGQLLEDRTDRTVNIIIISLWFEGGVIVCTSSNLFLSLCVCNV